MFDNINCNDVISDSSHPIKPTGPVSSLILCPLTMPCKLPIDPLPFIISPRLSHFLCIHTWRIWVFFGAWHCLVHSILGSRPCFMRLYIKFYFKLIEDEKLILYITFIGGSQLTCPNG